ncbi:MAG: OmpA family protein [Chlorobi bacterium]|nr:OmpA family protein [Chlorobiota bacterium]
MKKLISTVFILALIANISFGQNETKKFAFGVNAAVTDFFGPDNSTFYKSNEANFYPGPVTFTLAYNLIKPVNIATSMNFGRIDNYNHPLIDDFYWKADLGAQFRFMSLFLDDDHWFDPYLYANGGVFQVNNDVSPVINGGLGLNLWLNEYFAISGQTGYNYGFDLDDYLETTFGIKIRLGKGADRDGDGISDSKDACPDVFGLEQFNGCPDSDGDGIVDKDDACPNVAGIAEFNGCPDSDGDGIADKDDACPNEKGLKELNGCPDSDGDGIADKDDACPNEKGLKELNGCPDRDGDGIADKDDACPDKAGVAKLNGCPELKEEVKKQIEKEISFSAKNIQFDTGKSTIKAKSYPDLDNIVTIMKKYPHTKFSIDGYTDNTGNKESNLKLSDDRANAVKQYFINKGIAASRLIAKGHGDANPIASNRTAAGRAKNRRVEITIQK